MKLEERNKSLKDFFDMKADGYDDVHKKFMESKTAITTALPENTDKVLDLGGGTGLELVPLFEHFPKACVTVIDLCESMMEQIKKRPFADRVKCICGSFFDTPLGDCYDAVISTSSLHHFTQEDKARLYMRVFESLKPGGVFVNADKFCETQAEQDEWFRIYEEEPELMLHIDTPLTSENEAVLLDNCGFKCISFSPLNDDSYELMVAVKPINY